MTRPDFQKSHGGPLHGGLSVVPGDPTGAGGTVDSAVAAATVAAAAAANEVDGGATNGNGLHEVTTSPQVKIKRMLQNGEKLYNYHEQKGLQNSCSPMLSMI